MAPSLMAPSRRTCPSSFTKHVVLAALRASAGELAGDLERCRQAKGSGDEMLFKVSYQGIIEDRPRVAHYKGIIGRLLNSNPSGIMRKNTIRAALKEWNTEIGNVMSKPPDRLRQESYAIVYLVDLVKQVKKNTSTGERIPQYLRDLVCLLDCEVDGGAAFGDDESDDDSEQQLEDRAIDGRKQLSLLRSIIIL